MKVRLVALDVDGTLLNDEFEITEKTREAVVETAERGIAVVLCSGRAPESTLPLLETLGLNGYLIAHNGAIVLESGSGRVLRERTFGIAEAAPLIAYGREKALHFDVSTAQGMYCDRLSEEALPIYRKFYMNPIALTRIEEVPYPPVKMTFAAPPETLDRLMRDWPSPGEGLALIRSGAEFVDIMRAGTTKGRALAELAEWLGLDASEIMAIGNYYNDMDMLEYAGLGIAMANSPIEVLAKADKVTGSNNDDGVAEALRAYVLQS